MGAHEGQYGTYTSGCISIIVVVVVVVVAAAAIAVALFELLKGHTHHGSQI